MVFTLKSVRRTANIFDVFYLDTNCLFLDFIQRLFRLILMIGGHKFLMVFDSFVFLTTFKN